MAFIVEDGTGISNANSYTTVAFFKNYFLERGNSTIDELLDEDIKAALILGTDYIEMRFGSLVKGYKYLSTQALSFPMVSVLGQPIDKYIYPVQVIPDPLPLLDPETGLQMTDPITGELLTYIPEPPIPEPNGIEIPLAIQKAACEYAMRSRTASLLKDSLSDSMISQRVKIGQIEKETNFASNSKRTDLFSSFPSADLLLKPYLKSMGNMVIR